MPRRKLIVRPVHVHFTWSEELDARLRIYLMSGLTGKLPAAALQKFFTERTLEFFEKLERTAAVDEIERQL